jgi:hypothetical protein
MNTDHTDRLQRLFVSTLLLGMLVAILPHGVAGGVQPGAVSTGSGLEAKDRFDLTEPGVGPELALSVSSGLEAAGSPVACGASGGSEWMTTSSSFTVIRQCTLTVPYDGWAYVSADSSLGRLDGAYEAHFSIGIDGTAGDEDLDRWVNVYDDDGDGTDKAVALSILKPITAGTHTFAFLGRRYSLTGTVLAYNPSLSVVPLPSAGSRMLACGASGNMDWKTTSSSFEAVRQCTLTVPSDGWVFLSANGSLGWEDGEYEAAFSAGIDNTSGDPDLERRVNVYDDAGDGTDESVALSTLKPISAGTHTFYLLGRALAGTGTVLVYDPTLTVIYTPLSTTTPLSCGASESTDWETASNDFQVIRQCTLTVPYDGWAYVSADGTLGRKDGEYEANLSIGVDSAVGDADLDRWVNVYDDAGDGTDKAVTLSMLQPVTAGTHTFFLVGRRQDGTGTVLVRDPTLTALSLVVRYDIHLPFTARGH